MVARGIGGTNKQIRMEGAMVAFSIRVTDEDGDGVEGAEVYVVFASALCPNETAYTDSEGWAEIETEGAAPWGALVSKVAVNDEWVDEDGFDPDDGGTYSYVLP
jgi:hypothetical protein